MELNRKFVENLFLLLPFPFVFDYLTNHKRNVSGNILCLLHYTMRTLRTLAHFIFYILFISAVGVSVHFCTTTT